MYRGKKPVLDVIASTFTESTLSTFGSLSVDSVNVFSVNSAKQSVVRSPRAVGLLRPHRFALGPRNDKCRRHGEHIHGVYTERSECVQCKLREAICGSFSQSGWIASTPSLRSGSSQ